MGENPIPRRRRARSRPRRAASRLDGDVPDLLPAPGELHLPPALLAMLSEADRHLGRLQGHLEARPETNLFAPGFELREATANARLTGSAASLREVLRSRFETDDRREIRAVRGCRAAARHGRERMEELPVGTHLMRSVHARLLEAEGTTGGRPGRFRQVEPLSARSRSESAARSEAPATVPPVPRMRQEMEDLDDFLEMERTLPPILSCALAHAQVWRMRPFREGTARVARILISLLLADTEVLTRPVLCPSRVLERHREAYRQRLAKLAEDGGREAWLTFFLRVLAEASGEAEDAVTSLRRMRAEHRRRVRTGSRSSHAPVLLDHLLGMPITTANAAAEALDVHYVTANNLIGELEEMELLREVTGRRRDRVFLYEPYVTLLEGS